MSKTFRQGDLLFKKVESIPNTATPSNDPIILRGEATGHAHRIKNGLVYRMFSWRRNGGTMFLKAGKGAVILHEEHAPLQLEIGFYMIIRQREYAPEAWGFRLVED